MAKGKRPRGTCDVLWRCLDSDLNSYLGQNSWTSGSYLGQNSWTSGGDAFPSSKFYSTRGTFHVFFSKYARVSVCVFVCVKVRV